MTKPDKDNSTNTGEENLTRTKKPKLDKKQRRKRNIKRSIRILLAITTLGVMSYPLVSDVILGDTQQGSIKSYNKKYNNSNLYNSYVETLQNKNVEYSKLFSTADTTGKPNSSSSENLDRDDLSTVAVLSIPKIKEQLPVYSNSSEKSLDNGVGVLEGTDMPTGGKGRHSAITGHRGLSASKLFTDLPELAIGDKFYLKVNGEIHAYQVDQKKKVDPNDLNDLQREPDKDYVTLITCTPIFVNTKRLLIRGERVPYNGEKTDYEGLSNYGKLSAGLLAVTSIMYGVQGLTLLKKKFRLKS